MMPSVSSVFSAYASISASVVLVRSIVDSVIPTKVRNYMVAKICSWLSPQNASKLTLILEEYSGMTQNQLYGAAEVYLSTKIGPDVGRLGVSQCAKEDHLTIRLEKGEKIVDTYEGIELTWKFISADDQGERDTNICFSGKGKHVFPKGEYRFFELSFHKQYKDKVLGSYLPYVLRRLKAIKDAEKVVKLHTRSTGHGSYGIWDSVNMDHPATFQTLAMDMELKRAIIDDLNRFLRRKNFYKRVGRAWKRGYLLYGPPGTGKSSLIAAIANYMRYHVYDLQLSSISNDADLRRLLLSTANRSILVIEDIDCSLDLSDRSKQDDFKLSLSGLLNFIDGLWSCCGDERIIIFTTNHKDKIDPALLRPGRMDMHIHMSYCTPQGFKILASNYLGVSGHHPLFPEIEGMLQTTQVTPAHVAEELMKSEDADVALGEVVNLLKRKKAESMEAQGTDRDGDKDEMHEAKRQRFEGQTVDAICNNRMNFPIIIG